MNIPHPIGQIAYVVADMDAALAFWTGTIGVGPFFVREHAITGRVEYRGQPTEIDFAMAIGYWGDVQIELIHQHNAAPSIYRAWQDDGGVGVHHIGVFVDDMQPVRDHIAATGIRVEQQVWIGDGAGEALYVDTGGGPGTMVEYVCLAPELLQGFAAMRAAATQWDGSDPIRYR